jgi:diaminohydroxyphosphoribosylaminopyrimidine deaminase/5-amino-6-(5-phosphoribosylamino)uracil reductase
MKPDMTPIDRLYLERAYELASRGIGSTSPNPPVGAVVVHDGRVVGEGYHHRAGCAHAEVEALQQAGDLANHATLYVSLEPCNHHGRTPPCTEAIVRAGIARVVAGTLDPNPKTSGGGIAHLRAHDVAVDVADDERARELIGVFRYAIAHDRTYVALKMAMSLDGRITSRPGVQEWITSEAERLYVRDLRIMYDAVMVGAGTIRVDDSQLTVRPPHHRLRPYVRIVACESDSVPESSRVFDPVDDYATTIVLAPAGARERFANLGGRAEMLFVGDPHDAQLDLVAAMRALRAAGVHSVLCEGGPTLAARLLAARIVDRCYWVIAPVLLTNGDAVPVLGGADLATLAPRLRFESVERIGEDVVISCSVD